MNDTINLFNIKESIVDICEDYIKDEVKYTKILFKPRLKACPYCLSTSCKFHGTIRRIYNNPMVNHIPAKIEYLERRLICKECNKTFYEDNPFSELYKQGSFYETMLIMDKLKTPDLSFTAVAKMTNCSITKVEYVFDKHFYAERKRLPRILSIDEYYDPGVGIGKYDCLLVDFETGKVIDVLPDRSKYHITRELQTRARKELESVEYISIDMWEPYRDLTRTHFTKAKVCVDSFHVIKNILKSLDDIRIRIMNTYEKNAKEYYLLKHFNFLLLTNARNIKKQKEIPYNHVLERYVSLVDILGLILDINEELREAYVLKEMYINFNDNSTIETAEDNLNHIIDSFTSARANEYIEIQKMLRNWKKEIINSFNLDKNGRRINNSLIESRNSIIKKILRNANGYRNFRRLRNRITYCLNNDAYPTADENKYKIPNKGIKRGKYNKRKD